MLLEDSVLETEKPKRTTATFFVVVCFLVFFLIIIRSRKPQTTRTPKAYLNLSRRWTKMSGCFFLMSLVPVLRSRGFELPLDC